MDREHDLAAVFEEAESSNDAAVDEVEYAGPVDIENGALIDEEDGKAVIMNPKELVAPDNIEDEPTSSEEEQQHAEIGSPEENNTNVLHESDATVELGSPDIEETNNTVSEQDYTFAMNVVETGAPGYIKLRLASGKKRTVPNCCAVCLCPYEEGETVVWSSNRACKHAFHEECVVEWLIKMQDGTPCPCCRQEFTDVDQYKMMRKKLESRASFDVSVIHL